MVETADTACPWVALVVDTADECPGVVEWAVGGGGRLETTTDFEVTESFFLMSCNTTRLKMARRLFCVCVYLGVSFLGMLQDVDDISHCCDTH